MSRLIMVHSSPVLCASGYDSVRVSTCYHIIERGQNQSFFEGSAKKPGLQNRRETPTVKGNEIVLTHRRRSLSCRYKYRSPSRLRQVPAWLAGCSWPYRAASAALKRLSGADISAEEIRLLLNRHGQQRAAQQQAEAERVCAEPAQEPVAVEPAEQALLVGVDGGWVG